MKEIREWPFFLLFMKNNENCLITGLTCFLIGSKFAL